LNAKPDAFEYGADFGHGGAGPPQLGGPQRQTGQNPILQLENASVSPSEALDTHALQDEQ